MTLPSIRPLAALSSSAPLRIAVADDDRAMRELVVYMLKKQGHEVVAVAASGQELVDMCAHTQPDVILTDNLMPDLDGADAAAMIYARHPTPIILMSGFCDRNLVLEAEEKHVLIYLIKPVNEDSLRAALNRCRTMLTSAAAAQSTHGA